MTAPTIREAVAADLEHVLALARNFFAATSYADIIDFDDQSFIGTFNHLIQGGGVCLVGEMDGQILGFTGAMAYPFYFNANHKTGQELFWWVEPQARGSGLGSHMFKALEQWARDQGCKTFSMIALDSLRPEAVAKVYRRSGYLPSEHSYIKEL